MSIRETSGYESGNEIRNWIGLQFFAEGGDGGAHCKTTGNKGSAQQASNCAHGGEVLLHRV